MSLPDYRVAKSNHYSDHGASGGDFQKDNPESYLGDGRLFGLSSRRNASGDRNFSRKIGSVGRGSDYGPKVCRAIGNTRKRGATVCLGVSRGICDCGRACKKVKNGICLK